MVQTDGLLGAHILVKQERILILPNVFYSTTCIHFGGLSALPTAAATIKQKLASKIKTHKLKCVFVSAANSRALLCWLQTAPCIRNSLSGGLGGGGKVICSPSNAHLQIFIDDPDTNMITAF